MRKCIQLIDRFLLATIILCCLPLTGWADGWDGSSVAAGFAGGSGSSGDPYQISSPEELAYLAKQVKEGTGYSGSYFKLTNDIDLNNQKWTPIGMDYDYSFKGTFDGNGHQVQNLYFDQTVGDYKSVYAGLFGYMQNGTIKNLGVVISEKGVSGNVTAASYSANCWLGGIAGYCYSSNINNSYTTGGYICAAATDNVSTYAGGLVGMSMGTDISNCYSTVDVYSGERDGGSYVGAGGIVGYTQDSDGSTTIRNCFSTGMISAKNAYSSGGAGGIVGFVSQESNATKISNCLALNYKLITKDGNAPCLAGRIMGNVYAGGGTPPSFSGNYAYNNIIGENITTNTSAPIVGSGNAADKDGDAWDWTTSIPSGIVDNTSNWDAGTLPVMPKLKTTDGNLMANQPDVTISYPLDFAIFTNGSVHEKYNKTYAGKNTQVELTVTPDPNYGLKSLTYTPESEGVVSITENSGHYYFTMPDKKVTINAVFIIKSPITIAGLSHGSISIDGNKAGAIAGEKIIFTVTPEGGHKLDGEPTVTPSGGGNVPVNSEGSNKYSFTMPDVGVTIAAVFEPEFTIHIGTINNGTITVTDGKTAAVEGEEVKFTAQANSGYKLDGVSVTTDTSMPVNVTPGSASGEYSFTMPPEAVTIEATFSKEAPVPQPPVDPTPPVYYTVTLPFVEGAVTDPIAGEYEVESWSSFRFYLTPEDDYNLSAPVVTTSRGETIAPRSSDGAYIVKYVRTDVQISIDGVVKNPDPVANETIAADGVEVFTAGGYLYIRVATQVEAAVYDFNGKLLKQIRILPGETRWQLPSGAYIVKVDGKRYKVLL